MTVLIIILAALVVLLLIYVIATFNGLIRLKNRAEEGYSDIDVQLKRRHDLIPNLVETVKGYASHERQVFENVTAARSNAVAAQGPEAQAQAENALSGALRQLFAVAEAYPELKASQNFIELQDEITDTEDKIQAARRFYNMTVRDLNTKVETFPPRLIAGPAGVSKRDFFELEDRADREVPAVSFEAPPAPRG
jgi:LemA protein